MVSIPEAELRQLAIRCDERVVDDDRRQQSLRVVPIELDPQLFAPSPVLGDLDDRSERQK